MNILLLEDRGSRLYELKEFLEDFDHTVYPCENVYRAKDTWNKQKSNIDCAIIDLAMHPGGLRNPDDSQSGYYTGWVFLQENVFQDPDKPGFINRCLILSAWAESFKGYLDSTGKRNDIQDELILSKSNQDINKKLLRVLENIQKNNKNIKGTENVV
jgi:CheY-like chemotaxis protein